MYHYDPANHYWIVGGSEAQVWSSSAAAYVPETDPTYAAWLAAGGLPTKIASAPELAAVLQQQWLPTVLAAGIVIASAATPAIDGTYALDSAAQVQIASISTGIAAGKPLPGGGATFNYPDVGGEMHTFNASDFLNFAAAVESYLYALVKAIGTLVTGLAATLPSRSLSIA